MFDEWLLALLGHTIQMLHLNIWELSVSLKQKATNLESEIHELNDTLEKLGISKINIEGGKC